jgi:hypothetical protein
MGQSGGELTQSHYMPKPAIRSVFFLGFFGGVKGISPKGLLP